MQVDTHVYGSWNGYQTLFVSPGVSSADLTELERMVFGQPSDPEDLFNLDTRPCILGRPLPSGRIAITRAVSGQRDDAGRPTIMLITIIFDVRDFLRWRPALRDCMYDNAFWKQSEFRNGQPLKLSSAAPPALGPSREAWLAADLWAEVEDAPDVMLALPANQESEDAIVELVQRVDPKAIGRIRWGIWLLSENAPASIATLAPFATGSMYRKRQNVALEHPWKSRGFKNLYEKSAAGHRSDFLPGRQFPSDLDIPDSDDQVVSTDDMHQSAGMSPASGTNEGGIRRLVVVTTLITSVAFIAVILIVFNWPDTQSSPNTLVDTDKDQDGKSLSFEDQDLADKLERENEEKEKRNQERAEAISKAREATLNSLASMKLGELAQNKVKMAFASTGSRAPDKDKTVNDAVSSVIDKAKSEARKKVEDELGEVFPRDEKKRIADEIVDKKKIEVRTAADDQYDISLGEKQDARRRSTTEDLVRILQRDFDGKVFEEEYHRRVDNKIKSSPGIFNSQRDAWEQRTRLLKLVSTWRNNAAVELEPLITNEDWAGVGSKLAELQEGRSDEVHPYDKTFITKTSKFADQDVFQRQFNLCWNSPEQPQTIRGRRPVALLDCLAEQSELAYLKNEASSSNPLFVVSNDGTKWIKIESAQAGLKDWIQEFNSNLPILVVYADVDWQTLSEERVARERESTVIGMRLDTEKQKDAQRSINIRVEEFNIKALNDKTEKINDLVKQLEAQADPDESSHLSRENSKQLEFALNQVDFLRTPRLKSLLERELESIHTAGTRTENNGEVTQLDQEECDELIGKCRRVSYILSEWQKNHADNFSRFMNSVQGYQDSLESLKRLLNREIYKQAKKEHMTILNRRVGECSVTKDESCPLLPKPYEDLKASVVFKYFAEIDMPLDDQTMEDYLRDICQQAESRKEPNS